MTARPRAGIGKSLLTSLCNERISDHVEVSLLLRRPVLSRVQQEVLLISPCRQLALEDSSVVWRLPHGVSCGLPRTVEVAHTRHQMRNRCLQVERYVPVDEVPVVIPSLVPTIFFELVDVPVGVDRVIKLSQRPELSSLDARNSPHKEWTKAPALQPSQQV